MLALSFREVCDWFVLALTVGAAFSLGWSRKLRPFPLLLLASGIFLSFRTGRDLWFVVVAAIPIIAEASATVPATERFLITKVRAASCAGVLLIAFGGLAWRRDLSPAHLEAVVAEAYPAAAVAAVHAHDYQGPLYNDYNWGGFLIWSLRAPLVSLDNRGALYGVERVERFMKIWAGGEEWNADPDLAAARLIIANKGRPLASLLRRDPRFELVYEDKITVVFTARAPSQEQSTASLASQ